MAKELQGEQNLEIESESDEGNSCLLLQIKKPFEAVETESHSVFIPPENGSAVVLSQEEELVVDETGPSVDDISQFHELYWRTPYSSCEPAFPVMPYCIKPPTFAVPTSFHRTPYSSSEPAFPVMPHFIESPTFAVPTSFHRPDIVVSQPGITFIMRQRTNLKESKDLLPEPDQEIAEGDAVCEKCYELFKVNEDMVKMKCKCYNQLFHEGCVANTSNCGTCEQQVQRIPLTLLERRRPDDAGVRTQNGKKHKWF